ncbi:ribosomal protein S18-alanine N-acetyltransferase [Glaciecola sp. MH2013]|uniref:ribosomal protein S18-alanine N-acetyltransferase n=1 Tax=Glaciecola sp. MH2013 TaxID=2785524 RepID=UPI00189D2207|nr:ribosomal protein S18-alanine N-acetyltransferase [Glaciecola sp. MH2013]MBF7072453.1 ribosomal protein S18-alanine N-acetyltransferase [Glaciecola sp. MH2013]
MIKLRLFNTSDTAMAYTIFAAERTQPWRFDTFEGSALNGRSLVAVKNEVVVGYSLLSSVLDEETLEDIAVLPAFRKQGVGRSLVEASVTQAKKRGQKVIFLEVRQSNESAIAMYRSLGFELIGERKNYYDAAPQVAEISYQQSKTNQKSSVGRENALIMKKVL